MSDSVIVGLISDTHGLVRPEATEALHGSDFIIHAGDIGDPKVLAVLREIAPVTAVRGNIDRGAWAQSVHETEVLDLPGALIYVIHNVGDAMLDPLAAGFNVVVSGHSHQPGWREKDGVLYVNPGSAGPRRFSLPVSVGRLVIQGAKISLDLRDLRLPESLIRPSAGGRLSPPKQSVIKPLL